MLEESTFHSREIIDTALQLMSVHFQKSIHFSKIIQLSEPERRNLILRLVIENPTTAMPRSLILKKVAIEKGVFEATETGETEAEQMSRFARDWAGTEFLSQIGSDHSPHFYVGNLEHKFIIIEDLGSSHPSLVQPLTKSPSSIHSEEAKHALFLYIQRLGRIHADTTAKSSQYDSILKRIYPHAQRFYLPETNIEPVINQFRLVSQDELQILKQEIDDVLEFSLAANEFKVLLHGDICPDNVYYRDNEIKFIDFEFSDFGNALIDGVYLRMHMPSCWCSKAVPDQIIREMESIYRTELKQGIPTAIDDDIYNKQLIYACAYWVIRTINQIHSLDLIDNEWVCPSGPVELDSQWKPEENTFRPRVLSRLEAFVNCANNSGHLPKLCEISKRLHSKLRTIWPDSRSIDVFPVFRP